MSTADLWHSTPTPAQLALADYMSELSEEGFYAGWLIGVEFVLWRLAANPASMNLWDCSLFTVQQAMRLRQLSDACGGWVYWDDGADGLAFASAGQWMQIRAANDARNSPSAQTS